MNSREPDLSLIIPACNEQARIRPTLDAYLAYYGERLGDRFELLVVVNGSTDGTEAIVREYQSRHPALGLLVEPERVGKGGALMRGLRLARGKQVGFVDADGATAPAEFQRLVDQLPGHGAVIGSRWMPGARVTVAQSRGRRLASRLFNGVVRLLFGLRLHDTQCGAKVFTRETLAAVLPNLAITHWVFDVDLLFQVKRAGFSILEAPTEWHDVAGSKLHLRRALPEVLYALLRLRLLFSPLRPLVLRWDALVGRRAFERQLREGRLSPRADTRGDRDRP